MCRGTHDGTPSIRFRWDRGCCSRRKKNLVRVEDICIEIHIWRERERERARERECVCGYVFVECRNRTRGNNGVFIFEHRPLKAGTATLSFSPNVLKRHFVHDPNFNSACKR